MLNLKIVFFNTNISVPRKNNNFHKINIYLLITFVSQLSAPLSILQIKSTGIDVPVLYGRENFAVLLLVKMS